MKTGKQDTQKNRLEKLRINPYEENAEVKSSPRAWLQAHTIVSQMIDVCEGSLENPDWEPSAPLLHEVDMARLLHAYSTAAEIIVYVYGRSKKKVDLHILFDDEEDKCIFMLCFEIKSWGHISRVENRP